MIRITKMLVKIYSTYIILFIFLYYTTAVMKYPVVLVPGDGGSQMEAKLNKPSVVHYICDRTTKDWFSLWLNMELLVPVVIDCLIDNMRLVYDNKTRTTSNSPGVEVRFPGFGNCSTVEWIDPSKTSRGSYFNKIGDLLKNLIYTDGVSLRGAPYDFRKAPNEQSEYFKALRNLIEETYIMNSNKKVVIIAHSMGALMTLTLLQQMKQSWKDKYIRAVVSLSGAWGGSVKAVKVFAIGDDLGVSVLSGSTLRTEQISSPSLAWLMPSPNLWGSDEILVETVNKNYTLSNVKDFFYDINYEIGWEMYQDILPFAKNLDPPGVELHCLYGYGLPTVEKLLYAKGKFPESPKLITGDGDGTVNRRSLQACTNWRKKQKQPVYEVPLKNIDHMTILQCPETLDYVKQLFINL